MPEETMFHIIETAPGRFSLLQGYRNDAVILNKEVARDAYLKGQINELESFTSREAAEKYRNDFLGDFEKRELQKYKNLTAEEVRFLQRDILKVTPEFYARNKDGILAGKIRAGQKKILEKGSGVVYIKMPFGDRSRMLGLKGSKFHKERALGTLLDLDYARGEAFYDKSGTPQFTHQTGDMRYTNRADKVYDMWRTHAGFYGRNGDLTRLKNKFVKQNAQGEVLLNKKGQPLYFTAGKSDKQVLELINGVMPLLTKALNLSINNPDLQIIDGVTKLTCETPYECATQGIAHDLMEAGYTFSGNKKDKEFFDAQKKAIAREAKLNFPAYLEHWKNYEKYLQKQGYKNLKEYIYAPEAEKLSLHEKMYNDFNIPEGGSRAGVWNEVLNQPSHRVRDDLDAYENDLNLLNPKNVLRKQLSNQPTLPKEQLSSAISPMEQKLITNDALTKMMKPINPNTAATEDTRDTAALQKTIDTTALKKITKIQRRANFGRNK